MRVEITREDIRRGRPRQVGCSPMALALERQTGRIFAVRSDELEDDNSRRHPLPLEAQEFIARFDLGNPVEPITFELPYQL
jgi:hypothetical protein